MLDMEPDNDNTEDEDMDETGTVVVGVDGSPASREALEYALEEAVLRRAGLRVVAATPMADHWGTAFGLGAYGMGRPPPAGEIVTSMRAAAQRMVDDVVAVHPGIAAQVKIRVEAVLGAPAAVLMDVSRGADLLVLGHRGRGALSSAMLGSVGLHCVLHASCPVTIVRPVAPVAVPDLAAGATALPAPA